MAEEEKESPDASNQDEGSCSQFSAAGKSGTTWTWHFTDVYSAQSGMAGEWIVESADNAEGVWPVAVEGSLNSDSAEASFDYRSWSEYRCDEFGTWLLKQNGVRVYGDGSETSSEAVFVDELLVVPNTLSAGDSWESRSAVTVNVDGEIVEEEYEAAHFVNDVVSVSVPAGTWEQAIEIESSGPDGIGLWYIAEEVGAVSYETSELTSWTPG
ncbi:MAG: hypothetical protein ACOZNI_10965 [Myxococcota bacterium]